MNTAQGTTQSTTKATNWLLLIDGLSSNREEIANSITHGTGFLLSLAAACFMVPVAIASGDMAIVIGCSVYVTTLVAVYAASTLSHVVQEPNCKRLLRMWDQGVIYLLIAGTYTPWGLAYLQQTSWWWMTPVMWGCAIVGFLGKVTFAHRLNRVEVPLYVLLGWLPVVSAWYLRHTVDSAGLHWMLAGGILYTVGTIFLVCDRRAPFLHSVWHILVICASAAHFWAILRYVVWAD